MINIFLDRKQLPIYSSIKIFVPPFQTKPDSIEATVFEEDTSLVLTVDKTIEYHEEHPIKIMTNVLYAKTYKPGSLVINKNNWYAVVVDVDADHMCQPEWIKLSYNKIFHRITKLEIHSIGISLLGTIHVQMNLHDSLGLFLENLASPPRSLKTIRLIVADRNVPAVCKALRQKDKLKKFYSKSRHNS